MSIGELTEESTHEDVQSLVDQIVEDRKGDDEKGDAQKIAEERDEPAIAETDSGSEDTADDGKADEGEEAGASEWLDDDLKAETTAYGISEEELADFTSREELERALRFFDRSALEAGRKATAEAARDEKGRFLKKSEEEAPERKDSEGQFEISLDKELYDEELVDQFTRMRDHYESRLSALETRFIEADARAEEQRFDTLVDSLGSADLFGKTGKENSAQLQRREDLLIAVKAQQIGLQTLGRDVDLNEALVGRVARMVFADEFGKKDLKARTRKIAKQSNGRMGGSATKAHDSAEPLMDEMRRLYKELEDAGS